MLKTLKSLLLKNLWANCLDTWYVASGSKELQSLYKSWPEVDLDLFYGKVNLVLWAFEWEKLKFFIFLFLVYSKVSKWSQVHHQWMLEVKDV